jgi:hypothetical protein
MSQDNQQHKVEEDDEELDDWYVEECTCLSNVAADQVGG